MNAFPRNHITHTCNKHIQDFVFFFHLGFSIHTTEEKKELFFSPHLTCLSFAGNSRLASRCLQEGVKLYPLTSGTVSFWTFGFKAVIAFHDREMMSCVHRRRGSNSNSKKKQRPLWAIYLLTNHKTEEQKKKMLKLCYPQPPKKQWSTQFNESQRCVRAYRTQMTLFLFHVLRRCVCFSDGIWRTKVLIRSVYSLEQNILLWKCSSIFFKVSLIKEPKKQNQGCRASSRHIFNTLCDAALAKDLSFLNEINGSRFMELTQEGRLWEAHSQDQECSDTLAALWGCIPPRRSGALS